MLEKYVSYFNSCAYAYPPYLPEVLVTNQRLLFSKGVSSKGEIVSISSKIFI